VLLLFIKVFSPFVVFSSVVFLLLIKYLLSIDIAQITMSENSVTVNTRYKTYLFDSDKVLQVCKACRLTPTIYGIVLKVDNKIIGVV